MALGAKRVRRWPFQPGEPSRVTRIRTALDATLAGLANGQAITGPSEAGEGVRTTRSRSSLLANAGHGVLQGGGAQTTGQNEGAGRGAPVARMRSTRGHAAARGNAGVVVVSG